MIRPWVRPVVADSVEWYVCRSVCRSRDPAETAEPIEMPFGLWTRVDPKNRVLRELQITACKGEFLTGKMLSARGIAG